MPHGDVATASKVGAMTRAAGLTVAAYGSYYKLATAGSPDFSLVLASAEALGAPAIRVWAGNTASAQADAAQHRAVQEDALRCADLAAKKDIVLVYEYHSGTLTDTPQSAVELLAATEHPYIITLWQPNVGYSLEQCLASLRSVLPRLQHVHAFHWWPDYCRLPLAEGRERWVAYIGELCRHGIDCEVLLEYVKDDSTVQLAADAAILNQLCRD